MRYIILSTILTLQLLGCGGATNPETDEPSLAASSLENPNLNATQGYPSHDLALRAKFGDKLEAFSLIGVGIEINNLEDGHGSSGLSGEVTIGFRGNFFLENLLDTTTSTEVRAYLESLSMRAWANEEYHLIDDLFIYNLNYDEPKFFGQVELPYQNQYRLELVDADGEVIDAAMLTVAQEITPGRGVRP